MAITYTNYNNSELYATLKMSHLLTSMFLTQFL